MQLTPGATPSRLPTVLVAVALVLALIGVGAVAFGAADKPSKKAASTGSTTTSTVFASDATIPGETTTTAAAGSTGGTTATTAKSSTGTTAKPGTTATTSQDGVGDCPAGTASATDPGAAQAPAVGTYTYVSCTDSSDTSESKVAAAQSGNGVTRRTITEEAEQGASQTSTRAFGPNGVLDELWTIHSGLGDFRCDWNPDLLLFPAQLTVGKTWNVDSSCTIQTPQGNANLHVAGTGKISGRVQVSVGGTNVNAWVVDATIHVDAPGQTVDQTVHEYWDPAHGVAVYRNVKASTAQGSVTRVDRLKSLTPGK
jgi:hypothetical protein